MWFGGLALRTEIDSEVLLVDEGFDFRRREQVYK
jgi:hypothetical protein